MALFDFLKRKKEVEKSKEKQPGKEAEKVLVAKKEAGKDGKKSQIASAKATARLAEAPARRAKGGFSYDIVESPHVSEKGTKLADHNKYIFKIRGRANKPEIKKTIEGIYGVGVASVKIIKIPAKKRRIGRTEGFKKGYSKAVVTVKEGQKIEII